MTLPVSEHLERAQATGGIDPRRVGDEVFPSDDLIDEHVAGELAPAHRLPGAQAAVRGLRAREARDLLSLRRIQRHDQLAEPVGLREECLLRRFDREVLRGDDELHRRSRQRREGHGPTQRMPIRAGHRGAILMGFAMAPNTNANDS